MSHWRAWVAAGISGLLLLSGSSTAQALDLRQRSISTSRQFIVYCPDVRLRMAVAGFVETAKSTVLQALGLGDHWKMPIVVNLENPSTSNPGRPLCVTRLINTDEGCKVEIDVALRTEQFREVYFPQQIVRAILLEITYRDHPPGDGKAYSNPPAWLVEGLAEQFQARATASQPNAALFQQLIQTGRLPSARDFLASNVEVMDSTSRAIFAACSSSLLEMLIALPEGRQNLSRMTRDLNQFDGESANLLLSHFPQLGNTEATLEKWWTLGLAHNSASERYLGLTVPETEARLSSLMTVSIVTDEKTGAKTAFDLSDYPKFMKLRTAQPALFARSNELAGLLPQANPLLRPVVIEYGRIVADLARGKTHHADEALRDMRTYRTMIVERMDSISDYLNWFEATQMPEQSGAFDRYMKTATALENSAPPKRNDAITRYIDQVDREFQ
ncbi:MAG: hypothetical protein WCP06_08665 [Verrucomicrobiota bacterium]